MLKCPIFLCNITRFVIVYTLADEWLNITGALDLSKAALMVVSETWLRSTIIPSLFISSIISNPNSESPLFAGGIGFVAESTKEASDQGVLQLCVNVIYLAPSSYNTRSMAALDWIEWPPSIAIKLAIFLLAMAFSISKISKSITYPIQHKFSLPKKGYNPLWIFFTNLQHLWQIVNHSDIH